MNHIIFVYGTLKRGGRWHFLLEQGKCLEIKDSIRGILYLHESLYPMLFQGSRIVHGETYEVNEEIMEKIRIIEFEYEAKMITTTKGHIAEVFYYKHPLKKNEKRYISGFDARKYFKLWLEKNPKGSKAFQSYIAMGGRAV